jgi:hypothetical protein
LRVTKIVTEVIVQGSSDGAAVVATLASEPSALNKPLNFAFPQLDRQAAQMSPLSFAVPTHSLSASKSAHGRGQRSRYRGIMRHWLCARFEQDCASNLPQPDVCILIRRDRA